MRYLESEFGSNLIRIKIFLEEECNEMVVQNLLVSMHFYNILID